MRAIYPKEIDEEREAMIPFLEFKEDTGFALRKDAPPEIVERYSILQDKIEKFITSHL